MICWRRRPQRHNTIITWHGSNLPFRATWRHVSLNVGNGVWSLYRWQSNMSRMKISRNSLTRAIIVNEAGAVGWVTGGSLPCGGVSNMMRNLGWRSLENRRFDAHLITFYKVVHGFVAIPVPSYFKQPKDTHATCILFRSDKFTPLSATISIHFPHVYCSLEQTTSWSRPGFRSWLL